MPRLQAIPEELKRRPVTIADAERLGFSRQRFRGPNWRRVGCGTYAWRGLELGSQSELVALVSRLPQGCIFSGLTAARLHGFDTDGRTTVEVTVLPGVSVRARANLRVHTAALDPSEVTMCGALSVTTPLRTCLDLARRLPLVDAVVALDRALHLKLVGLPELRDDVDRRSRLPGLPQARMRRFDQAAPMARV